MSRLTLLILALSVSLAAGVLLAPAAQAARPCGTEKVPPQNAKARVAVIDTSCATGLEVAADLYAMLAAGKKPDASFHYEVDSFRCVTGLASTELQCHRGDSWVFASTRPEDHPGQAHVPRRTT
jgi:hypothetical protein